MSASIFERKITDLELNHRYIENNQQSVFLTCFARELINGFKFSISRFSSHIKHGLLLHK